MQMGFRWNDPFGTVARRQRRKAEFEQHVQFARRHGLMILRVDRVYQKARTGQKAVGIHLDSGYCDIWFSGLWPPPQKVYIVRGFWDDTGSNFKDWHHHSPCFLRVNHIASEFSTKVWDAAMRG